MNKRITSGWTGSEVTSSVVRNQIAERFGESAAQEYNPEQNCLTYNKWLELGYQVKKGEKALTSFIIVEKKDKDGNVIEKYPKRIHLFYHTQVVEIEDGSDS